MPIASASGAEITGLVSRIDIARRKPTSRDSVTDTPASGAIATRVAPARNFADSPAMTISEAQTRPKPPPPAAKPCTEVMTGASSRNSPVTAFCR